MKPESANIFWEGPQKSIIRLEGSSGSGTLAGLIANITQTALHTILIFSGGLDNALISLISVGLIVFKASIAASSTGIASAKSASTEVFCAVTISASLWATSASADTVLRVSITPGIFSSICPIRTSVAAADLINSGCKSANWVCMVFTCSAANANFSKPVS